MEHCKKYCFFFLGHKNVRTNFELITQAYKSCITWGFLRILEATDKFYPMFTVHPPLLWGVYFSAAAKLRRILLKTAVESWSSDKTVYDHIPFFKLK